MLASDKILRGTDRANNIFFPSNCIIFQNDTKKSNDYSFNEKNLGFI